MILTSNSDPFSSTRIIKDEVLFDGEIINSHILLELKSGLNASMYIAVKGQSSIFPFLTNIKLQRYFSVNVDRKS